MNKQELLDIINLALNDIEKYDVEQILKDCKNYLSQLDNERKISYKSAINMTPQRAKEWMIRIRDNRISILSEADDEFVLEDIWALDYVIGLLDYIKE